MFSIVAHTTLAIDTETTGLNPYHGDRLFSIIISTCDDDYYFNFNERPDHLGNQAPTVLNRIYLEEINTFLKKHTRTIYMHNAKFDLHFLAKEGINLEHQKVVCTQAAARLVHNQLPSYSLAALGELIGHKKDDTVEKYISKNKLYTLVDVGKKKPRKDLHYDLVPFNIISNYGMQDGRVTYELGRYISNRLRDLSLEHVNLGLPQLDQVTNNEIELTQTLFKMESRGALIDQEYCQEAFNYEKEMYLEAAEKFYVLTGEPFEDAASCFKKVFDKMGLEPGRTAKGNPSFSEENLPDNPVTQLILQYRKHYKRAHTYFKNYLDLVGPDGAIHCNFRQSGTSTGRMSSSYPNLQNVPKRGEDSSKYPVRRCFIPRPGYFLAMIDWDQMEYRMLLDIAREEETIRKINEEGLCVHQATAKMMEVEREPAKTLNFMLLYGGGATKLAMALHTSVVKAKQLKSLYFRTLGRVKTLVKAIISTSERRGFIVNWLGRRLLLDERGSYKMPNHYIQGGCGDVCKKAMNKIDSYLESKDAFMLLQVHDELIFEVAYGHEYVLEEIKNIMENTYPHHALPLTAGVDVSKTDWFNKEGYNA